MVSFLDGGQNFLCGQLRVQRRNGVTNQVANGVHLISDKAIVLGERLEQRRFANGDSVSALVRVPKSALAWGRASAVMVGDAWSQAILPYTLVKPSYPFRWQWGRTDSSTFNHVSSGFRCLEALLSLRLKVSHHMPVVRLRTTIAERRLKRNRCAHVADHFSNRGPRLQAGTGFGKRACDGFGKCHSESAPGEKDQASPGLRDTEVRHLLDAPFVLGIQAARGLSETPRRWASPGQRGQGHFPS